MIPKSTAPREIRLAETCRRSISTNANNNESGMMSPTITALRQSPRKTMRMTSTSMAPTARFSCTVCTV